MTYTPYEGVNFRQSHEPEAGGIWPEVGGDPLDTVMSL